MARVALDPIGATRAIVGEKMGSGSRENVQQDMANATIKVIEYSLAAGAEERAFLKTSSALMSELARLKGYIKRELHKGENGRWRDIVYWQSRKDADQSEFDIPNIPACVKCIGMMNHADMTVTHFELIQESKNDV